MTQPLMLSPYELGATVRTLAAKMPSGTPNAIESLMQSMVTQYQGRFDEAEARNLANLAVFPPVLIGEYTWYRR